MNNILWFSTGLLVGALGSLLWLYYTPDRSTPTQQDFMRLQSRVGHLRDNIDLLWDKVEELKVNNSGNR
jgi:hypothetical protein